VIIKGTEFYDAKQKKYVDFPITDVLQMMGRAGRPQFDTTGKAHVMVHDIKKAFYKKFLHEPFPVESSLHEIHHLYDHINAEIVAGTISGKQEAIDYLTWTYFYRRLRMNPTYYGLIPDALKDELEDDIEDEEDMKGLYGYGHVTGEDINQHLSFMIDEAMMELDKSGCISLDDEAKEEQLLPTVLGVITSYYYLRHTTGISYIIIFIFNFCCLGL
jgi:activating signal cointegrator complex subunit 3